jgi:predicted Fe-Mo cluster-binding NifX family protein
MIREKSYHHNLYLKNRNPMKIAVPVNNGFVNDHFGHSEEFIVYSVTPDKKIESVTPVAGMEGCGCKSGIAGVLAEQGVSVLLAGNIGGGAINHLNASGIGVIRGCHGPADLAVLSYLDGRTTDNEQTCTAHEGCENH